MTQRTKTPLQAILEAAIDAITDLARGLPECEKLIHDPRRSPTLDGDRVSGSVRPGDLWPDPEARAIWLAVQRGISTAHHHIRQTGHSYPWSLLHPDRPATLNALLAGLHIVRTGLATLRITEWHTGIPDHQREPAGQAARAILAAHRDMPAGMYQAVQPEPSPAVRMCAEGCGRPAASKRRQCWPCVERTRKPRSA